MIDLTVVILTKNEEKNLRKCVESFRGIVKRFVIVDSFSTDSTEKVCNELHHELSAFGSRLDYYQHEFVNHAEQMNWGLSNTCISTKWSMKIDADEELTEALAKELAEKLPLVNEEVNGIILRRRVYFMGRWIKHGGRYPELLLRIIRTGEGACEQKIMDEHMIVYNGKVIQFNNDFIDNNQKSLEWWIAKHNWYSNKEVQDYQSMMCGEEVTKIEKEGISSNQAMAKRHLKNGGYYKLPKFWRAHIYFLYRYYIKLGFLDGPEGKIFHFLQAYWYRFLVDAKMYECEKKRMRMEPQNELKV